jgi:16S rRNA processing protein RimM
MADHALPDEPPPGDGYLAVAHVVGVHGIRGDLRCVLLTDFPDRFKRGLRIFLGDEHSPHEVERARLERNRVVLKLNGVDSRTDAEALRGATIFVAEGDAVRLPRGSYFWHQIIGLRVRTAGGKVLGTVAEIIETGSNDVYVVRRSPPDSGELLLPAIKDVVRKIDLARGEITVELLEGLG